MKKVLVALLLVGVLAGAGAGGWYLLREQRITAFASTPVELVPPGITVELPPGSSPRAVAQRLAQAGVVSDGELFYLYIRRAKAGPKLKAGEYLFEGVTTPVQALQKMMAGQVKVYRFTVPEGLRAEEILPIVASSPLKLDLAKLEALASDRGFLRDAGVPAKSIEGFLYPDTYTFTRSADEAAVLKKMISRSLGEYARADGHRKPAVRLDMMRAITLASIVEKETGVPEERPRISCVFHNRLKLGMKLQTDPTVIYAMRMLRGVYSKNITVKDLKTEHPYNTYTTPGLPPGPIASPGAAAMKAALEPLECNDLFFVSRNDGSHVFCPTLECHNAAVRKWQVEFFRAKRSGKKG